MVVGWWMATKCSGFRSNHVPDLMNNECMIVGKMIGKEQVSKLVGRNVELVCFAQYSIYVHLQGGTLLTVEAGLEHTHDGIRRVYHLSTPPSESSLLSILESTITSATVEENGDLQLTASNGDSLRIYKEPQYESYRLKMGSEELIPSRVRAD